MNHLCELFKEVIRELAEALQRPCRPPKDVKWDKDLVVLGSHATQAAICGPLVSYSLFSCVCVTKRCLEARQTLNTVTDQSCSVQNHDFKIPD